MKDHQIVGNRKKYFSINKIINKINKKTLGEKTEDRRKRQKKKTEEE